MTVCDICGPGTRYCYDPAGHGYLLGRAEGIYPASPCADAPPDPYIEPATEPGEATP